MNSSTSRTEFMDQWSALHGGAEVSGIVKGWLKISYRCAVVLQRMKCTPNLLTAFGVIFAAATAYASPGTLAALFLALSLLFDGVDGSLALVSGRTSKLGAVFDALADRVSEGLWAVAFYRLGIPLQLVLFLWLLAAIQEYARARAGAAGVQDVGVITPAERPVRASFLFIAIVAWQLNFSHGWISAIAGLLIILQLVGLVMVFRFAFQRLK